PGHRGTALRLPRDQPRSGHLARQSEVGGPGRVRGARGRRGSPRAAGAQGAGGGRRPARSRVAVTAIDRWWEAGERIELPIGGADRQIFVRRVGAGPAMTMLHGFPSSSHDWAKVAPALAERHSLLMPDFLGFGASDKPAEHEYSIHEQADLVEALWAGDGTGATVLVAHDYGATVAQELLVRRAEGALSVDLSSVHLLNGGLYPDLHRPEPAQMALLDPEQGPRLSAQMNAELIAMALRPTF